MNPENKKPDEYYLLQDKARIETLDREILEYQKVVKRLKGEVRKGWEKIADLQQNLQNQDQQLHEIYNSKAWKVLTIYRNLRAKLSQFGRKANSAGSRYRRLLTIPIEHSKKLLSDSGLFDVEHYLQHNSDVRNAGLDPIEHYLRFGGLEGRNPSADFDGKWYLANNPDLLSAKVNPLLHFVKFGKEEGCAIKAAEYSELNEKNMPDEILFSDDLVRIFKEKIYSGFEIALSHDSYLTVTGGVQNDVADEQKMANGGGCSYLHVYPFKKTWVLANDETPLYLGLNLDGQTIGETESGELIVALDLLKDKKLKNILIHHSMGFNLKTMQGLLNFTNKKGVFWIHDYFSLCPSYHLRRNDKTYCGAPNINSDSCQMCKYVEQRALQMPRFKKLFEENQLEVLAPSQFTLELWQSRFPIKIEGRISPPARLKWKPPSSYRNQTGCLQVAFLGMPVDFKGWDGWMRLVNESNSWDCHHFYHFSVQDGDPGNYKRINVQVTPNNRMAMVESLKRNKIDVAVLWSNVAETFSQTLHEALAAGCYILTNPNSGNIQDYVKRHPEQGMILEDENSLIELFKSKLIIRAVEKYQINGKPQADLIFGGFDEIEE